MGRGHRTFSRGAPGRPAQRRPHSPRTANPSFHLTIPSSYPRPSSSPLSRPHTNPRHAAHSDPSSSQRTHTHHATTAYPAVVRRGWSGRGSPGRGSGAAGGRGPRPAPLSLVRNDYNQHFVDTGQRPQNFIRESSYPERFDEYPKLKRLVELKDALVDSTAHDPSYLQCDLDSFDLTSLGMQFDVVLIDPPWREYAERSPVAATEWWDLERIGRLKIAEITRSPAFVFLWVGSGHALEDGRQLLRKWGFRRSEDICWIKTNRLSTNRKASVAHMIDDQDALLVPTKEHCLMGIKGSVRRNVDTHLIHSNVDTDVILTEEPEDGSLRKPDEMYNIIQHFCLSQRRLELFGEDHNIRRGWLTLGKCITSSNFSAAKYSSYFDGPHGSFMPPNQEIEDLRPKSPPRPASSPAASGGGGTGATSSSQPPGLPAFGGGGDAYGGYNPSQTNMGHTWQ